MRIGIEPYAMIAPLFCHGITMRLLRLTCLGLFCVAAVSGVKANDFEAALSKETAQFTFRSELISARSSSARSLSFLT